MKSTTQTLDLTSLNRYPDMNVRLVTTEDAEFIWKLRQHAYKSRHLHSVGPTIADQREWLRKYKQRERRGEEYYFIISDEKDQPQGLYRIYDIRKDRAEVGSWIFRENAPASMAVRTELMLKEFAFDQLGKENLYFDTRRKNKRIYTYSTMQNSEVIGEDDLNYYFRLGKQEFKKGKEKVKEVMQLTDC